MQYTDFPEMLRAILVPKDLQGIDTGLVQPWNQEPRTKIAAIDIGSEGLAGYFDGLVLVCTSTTLEPRTKISQKCCAQS